MRYWDSSAIVPLLVAEAGTRLAGRWIADDRRLVTWALSRVEIAAAIERRTRDGAVSMADRRRLLDRLEELASAWDEIGDVVAVRRRAETLLARHTLRAADALQLGAAMLAAEDDPPSLAFACLDRALAAVADREGFRVLTWPDATPA